MPVSESCMGRWQPGNVLGSNGPEGVCVGGSVRAPEWYYVVMCPHGLIGVAFVDPLTSNSDSSSEFACVTHTSQKRSKCYAKYGRITASMCSPMLLRLTKRSPASLPTTCFAGVTTVRAGVRDQAKRVY